MLLEEKLENDRLIKIYKSSVKVYEKDGNFEKIISGEQNLEEHNIDSKDLVDLIKKENTKSLTLNSNNIDKVLERVKKQYQGYESHNLDGLSIISDQFRFNLRSSNTEPVIKLNMEAKSKEILETEKDKIISLLK